MHILIVNDTKIPALKYGGTERVIWYLGKELVKKGHKVTFLVAPGSSCDFAGIIQRDETQPLERQIPAEVDFVHFFAPLTPDYHRPHMVTVEGNPGPDSQFDINTVFVSRNHACRYGSEAYVYNGMDWDDYGKVLLDNPRRYFHFLGKAAWSVKNIKGAISVMKQLKGEKLDVLGGYRFNLKMGVRFTFHPRIRFRGMVGGQEKNRLIQGSKGLLFPVRWHEPFGIAITESLYFGCPVYGTPYGSLPELVPSSVGFLSDRTGELAEAMRRGGFSARTCHEYARDLFNSRVMCDTYLSLYEKVLNGENLNPVAPAPTEGKRILLPWYES